MTELEERERVGLGGPQSGAEGTQGGNGSEPSPGETPADTDVITCPECRDEGVTRTFASPRALARHRTTAHGILSETAKKKAAAKPRRSRKPAGAKKPKLVLNETALLKAIYPNGMPLDMERLERTTVWMEEARELFTPGR